MRGKNEGIGSFLFITKTNWNDNFIILIRDSNSFFWDILYDKA